MKSLRLRWEGFSCGSRGEFQSIVCAFSFGSVMCAADHRRFVGVISSASLQEIVHRRFDLFLGGGETPPPPSLSSPPPLW